MAIRSLKVTQTKGKTRRKFQVVIHSYPEWKEIFIEADEISNIDGIIEVFSDSELIAVINDFIFIKEVPNEKTPV